MKPASLFAAVCWISMLGSFPPPIHGNPPQDAKLLAAGVVVEKVAKDSEAEKSGIQPGDVLLRSVRGDARDEIVSPFDLWVIEIEQAAKGNVTLEGLRGTEPRTWMAGPDVWGIEARPNFQGDWLDQYKYARGLEGAGLFDDAAGRWQSLITEIKASEKSNEQWLCAWIRFHAAATLDAAKEYKKADDLYEQAVQSAGDGGAKLRAELYRLWAGSLDQRQDWGNSQKYFQQALAEDEREGGQSLRVAEDLYDLGNVFSRQQNPAKAHDYYLQALTLQKELAPASLPLARVLDRLAYLEFTQGEFKQAEDYLNQSMAILEQRAPRGIEASKSLDVLGLIDAARGDLVSADSRFYRSLAILQNLAPETMDVARLLGNIGNVAWVRGDLAKAEEYFHKSQQIMERLAPNSLQLAQIVNNLGMLAGTKGDLKAALALIEQALAIKNKLAPESMTLAVSLVNLAVTLEEDGELDKAEEAFTKALVIENKLAPDGSEMALTFHGLGRLCMERHDPVKAESYFRKELAIWEKLAPGSQSHADALAALAFIVRDRRPELAAHLYEQALNTLDTQAGHLGGPDSARWNFRAQHADSYSEYIDLLVRQKQVEQAFSVLERSHARSLLEMLATAHINVRKGVDSALLAEEQSLQSRIAAQSNRRIALMNAVHDDKHVALIDKQIADLLARYQEIEERIRFTSPGYAALTQPRALGVKELQQQLLDRETLLLEYSFGEEHSYVFAVTADSVKVFALPQRAKIETLARDVYECLTARNQVVKGETDREAQSRWIQADAKYSRLSAELSNMVLGPAASLLMGHKRLLIVPDGALQYIPFAALPIPGSKGASLEAALRLSQPHRPTQTAAAPLVIEHEIVSLPSASVMSELRREEQSRPEPGKAVAVLADPVFDPKDRRVTNRATGEDAPQGSGLDTVAVALQESSWRRDDLVRSASEMGFGEKGELKLRRLEYTREEARSILAATPGENLEALDFQASREMAMNPALAQYRIIHFATHGILNSKHPELSGLVFSLVDSHGQPQNGFLDLQDIYDLKLPVDLVVLSGCETGLGKEIRGEGLIGLTRGFIYAGSSRVMASLWSVSDQATAELMAAFYRAMGAGRMSPAAALRAAQIETWKRDLWKSPYYWAAFQIQGEWQ